MFLKCDIYLEIINKSKTVLKFRIIEIIILVAYTNT